MKFLLFFILGISSLAFAQTFNLNPNEANGLKPIKNTLNYNPNLIYLDADKTIDLPADGAFLYSSLDPESGIISSGYNNNEDYKLTIKNQYGRRIFLRSHYFSTENKNDVLEIYDGQGTDAPLIKSISGYLDENFALMSSGEYLTIRFKSNNSSTSKGYRFRVDNGPGANSKPASPLPNPMACASTPAADECVNAPLICDLNGYCGNTSGSYTAGNTSALGAFCGSIENNSWLSFVASGTSASLGFNSGGCQDSNSGIQAVIYASSNCTSFTEVSNCTSQGSGSGTFTISTNVNLVPGQTYYVMIDGFAGNICNYTVTAQAGVALGQQITGPNQLCPGFSGVLGASSSASSYNWTSNPPGVYPNTQTITITPTVTTTYTLTMGPSACTPTGITIVKTVTVTNTLNPANITAPSPICMNSSITLSSLTNGGTYAWTGPSTFTSNTQSTTIPNWTAANNGLYTLIITYGPGCATSPATVNLTGTPSPTINIAAAPSLTVCSGQAVILTGSGGTGTNGYTWNWNPIQTNGTTQFCITIPFVGTSCNPSPFSIPGIAAGPSATFTPNQTTQICVASENAAGCPGNKCVTIVVLPAATALTVSPTASICAGQNTNLSVSGGGTTYTWSPAATLSSPNGATVTASPTVTTVYTVSTTVCGGSVSTATMQVVVGGTPPAIGAISGSTLICPNSTGITYSVTNVASTNYTWSVPAGASITSAPTNSNAITVSFGATAGTVSVTAVGTCGTATASINVGISPAISLTVTPNNTSICAGSSTTLTASGATNYTWSPSATLSSANGTTVSANPGSVTIYTVIGATGTCTGVTTATVNMSPGLSLTVTPNSSSVCAGGSETLTASGATNYTWSPSVTLSSPNGTSVVANPVTATTYTVIGSTGTCTGTATATISMATGLTLTLTANTPTVCPGSSALLDVNGATTYTWSPAGTLSSPNGSNVTATPLANTIYTVMGSSGTCTGSATISIGIGACVSSGCNLAFIRSTLTAAGNIELLGMNNSCSLYFINPQFMTGPQAQTYAQTFGANLISVQSASENADLVQALSNQGYAAQVIWIGYSDAITEGSYVWYDGAPLSYSNWAPGEPNDAGGVEDCTQIYPDGMWNDLNCSGYNSLSVIEVNICPQVSLVTIPPAQCPFTNVTLNATTLLGSPNYTYTWVQSGAETFTNTSTPGNTDQITISSTGPNTFTVFTEDRYSCPQSTTVSLSVLPSPTITVNSSTICLGQQTATLTANGAATYSWIPGTGLSATTGSVVTGTPGATQNYTVIGMGLNGCLNGTITSITVNSLPSLTVSPNVTICPSDATVLTASGTPSYTWSPASSLSSANGASVTATPTVPTTYTVQGSSANGCLATGTVNVNVSNNGFLPNVYIVQKNSLCDTSILNWLNVTSVTPSLAQGNLPNGITFNATHSGGGLSTTPTMFSGGTFPATYSVPIGATTIRNDLAGTFNFCFSQPVINPQIAFASIGQAVLPITITTGVPYQVLWTGVNMTYVNSTTLIGAEGFTIIRFPGIHSCISFDYSNNENYINLAFGVMDAACQGQPICPGTPLELIGNGATSYTWSTGANSSTITPAPLTTTTYSLTGANSDGCVNTSVTTVTVNPTPTITVNSSTICVGQQTATLTTNGANTYTWSAGLSSTTGSVVTGTPVTTQNYTVTGTDINGCISDTNTTITVNQLPNITVNSASICVGQQTAILTATGATTYSWIPGTDLSATTGSMVTGTPTITQNYTVAGMDANGCINGTITAITVNALPTVTVNSSTICVGQQTAVLTATGATTYSWIPGTGLSATTGSMVTGTPTITQNYTLAGMDANGCINGTTTTITVNSLPPVTATSSTICVGQQTATLIANGATTYSWIPGMGLSATTGSMVTGTPTITQNYTVAGMDANGCISGTTSTITVNPLPNITVNTATICVGQQTAILTATGAATYSWIPGTGLSATTGSMVTGTPTVTQNYTVAGMDANGCINGTITAITVNALPTVTVNSSTICVGQQTAVLTATGATTYSWIPGTDLSATTGSMVTGTPTITQNYTLAGMDANGCINGTTTTITVNSLPPVTATSSTICVGQQTATLIANGATTYSWIPGTGLSATTGSMVTGTPTVTQNYTVAGIDANGCINGTITAITVNPLPVIAVSPNMTVCPLSANTLTVNGAASYTWSPNIYLNNNNTASVISTPSVSTSYTIDGLSAASCSNTAFVNVVVTNTVVVFANASTPTICPLASSSLTASGATTYTWTPALTLIPATGIGGTVIATPSTSETYTVIGSTSTCTNSAIVVITVTVNPTISVVPNPPVICSGSSSTLTASGASTYTWSPATTLSSASGSTVNASPTVTSVYNVSGTSPLGCTSFTTHTLTVVSTPTIAPNAIPVTICAGSTSTLSVTGATDYTWSPGASISNVNASSTAAAPILTTTYTVFGTNGTLPFICTDTKTVQITVIPNPTLTPGPPTPICEGKSTLLYATGANTYTWSPTTGVHHIHDSTTNVKPPLPGVYVYTVSGTTNNCTSSATVEITVNPLPIIDAGLDSTINIDNTIALIGTGDTQVGFINASTGVAFDCNYCPTVTVNPQNSTCYTLEGISAFGCRITDEVCITVTKDWDVFIPNAFTPNGDLNNEIFIPMGYGIDQVVLTIYDRWGHLMFKSNAEAVGWDGKAKGRLCEQGVYVYLAEITAMSGEKIKRTGHVTLLARLK